MQLTDSQKAQVKSWVTEGLSLAQIQKQISEDFGVTMTYMDTRFLVDDLQVDFPAEKGPAPSPHDKLEEPKAPSGEGKEEPAAEWEDAGIDPEVASGSVSVDVDKVTRPGAVVSGSVTFANGKSAGWQLDQMGRLGLIPGSDNYQPTSDDIEAFQVALQQELQKHGF